MAASLSIGWIVPSITNRQLELKDDEISLTLESERRSIRTEREAFRTALLRQRTPIHQTLMRVVSTEEHNVRQNEQRTDCEKKCHHQMAWKMHTEDE
ncbi:hypothetical protein D3C80_1993870 [compost metagenome]